MLKFLLYAFLALLVLGLAAAGGIAYGLYHYGRGLPDYQQLADYEPPTVTRFYAGDGRLLAEYALEKRVFVPVDAIPRRVVEAFLAAEDKTFFDHGGIDVRGVARAAIANLRGMGGKRRPVGGSTITQQVAKNFLLSSEVTIERKVKEAILALRIERALPKQRILELYLNEIYLGFGSYGVAAAALNYFNRSLDELTLAETAFLAALPKGPNNYHPVRRPEAARGRRDWVIGRMLEEGFIAASEAAAAAAEDIAVRRRDETETVRADHFTEEVRREIADRYGDRALYEGGLAVRTTIDPKLQDIAERSLRGGLVAYDRRHGWRGAIARIAADGDWHERLARVERPHGLGAWNLAVVLAVDAKGATVGTAAGDTGRIAAEALEWARPWRENQRLGAAVKRAADVLSPGDVVAVEALAEGPDGAFALRQIPDVDGGLVVLDPHTGRVLAMVGGYQLRRQPVQPRHPGAAPAGLGVQAGRLHRGARKRLHAVEPGPRRSDRDRPGARPRQVEAGQLHQEVLRPEHAAPGHREVAQPDDRSSRPLHRHGEDRRLCPAPGCGGRAAAGPVDGARRRRNHAAQAHHRLCDAGQWRPADRADDDRSHPGSSRPHPVPPRPPRLPGLHGAGLARPARARDPRHPRAGDRRGLGLPARVDAAGRRPARDRGAHRPRHRHAAGGARPAPPTTASTPGSSASPRTWRSASMSASTGPGRWGRGESGSTVAAPIFRDFMAEALADWPDIPFRVPAGVRLVRVDAATGLPARPGDAAVILEAFRPGTEPGPSTRAVLDSLEGERRRRRRAAWRRHRRAVLMGRGSRARRPPACGRTFAP